MLSAFWKHKELMLLLSEDAVIAILGVGVGEEMLYVQIKTEWEKKSIYNCLYQTFIEL